MAKRKYNLTPAAKTARAANSKLPRPGQDRTEWKIVRIPSEMYKKHKKPGVAFHKTIDKKLRRKTKKAPSNH